LCHNINLLINIAEHDPDWETFSENYSILGLTPSASEDDIKKAFRKLALAKHPDKCPECADEYVKIKTAHENIQKYGELYKIKRAINLKTTKFPSMKSPRTKDEL
jgi:preprotein translocase subunit Sec63